MGNTATETRIVTLPTNSKPAHRMISGMRAMRGMAYSALMKGSSTYSSVRHCAMAMPSAMPTTTVSAMPTENGHKV